MNDSMEIWRFLMALPQKQASNACNKQVQSDSECYKSFNSVFQGVFVHDSFIGMGEIDEFLKTDHRFEDSEAIFEMHGYNYPDRLDSEETSVEESDIVRPTGNKAVGFLLEFEDPREFEVNVDVVASLVTENSDEVRRAADDRVRSNEHLDYKVITERSKLLNFKDFPSTEPHGKHELIVEVKRVAYDFPEMKPEIVIEKSKERHLDKTTKDTPSWNNTSADRIESGVGVEKFLGKSYHRDEAFFPKDFSELPRFQNHSKPNFAADLLHEVAVENKGINSSLSNFGVKSFEAKAFSLSHYPEETLERSHVTRQISLENFIDLSEKRTYRSDIKILDDPVLMQSHKFERLKMKPPMKSSDSNDMLFQGMSMSEAARDVASANVLRPHIDVERGSFDRSRPPSKNPFYLVSDFQEGQFKDTGRSIPDPLSLQVRNTEHEGLNLKFTTEKSHLMYLLDKNQNDLAEELKGHGIEDFNLTFFMRDGNTKGNQSGIIENLEVDHPNLSQQGVYISGELDERPLDLIV